ncbi:E3 ubiquitin-protein ligase RNF19B, partial [Galendromus occidentalis]|uniref:RBR-type E3 ubiquitin transferase n=1 Tax=Galendromus occidentalis TaxID=34638 RepID=A0AAJ7L6F1_9ACAR
SKPSKKDQYLRECPLCLLELHPDCFPKLSLCNHRTCWDCLQRYLRIEISEGRINIDCPECSQLIHPTDIRNILSDEATMLKYETFMLRRVLCTDRDARWCPAPDCTFVVIANNCATCPKLKCQRPGCDTEFCYHCKQEWHPNITCDMARQQRQEEIPCGPFPSTSGASGSTSGSPSGKFAGKEEMKNCPSCGMQIIKADDGSCNHMTCGICGKEFCWLCVKQITDLHYLSPSGCTFWGKKPWSRKKKILCQLGMLVGAPVGIALIAGIAIPGIIIGIPVFIGKKIYVKNREKSAMKRNTAVAMGVLLSMAFSPIVAAIAIGIGVPILLAYAYGVVPLSLLRSAGGWGVKASSSGVRLQFDEGPGAEEQQMDDGKFPSTSGEGQRRSSKVQAATDGDHVSITMASGGNGGGDVDSVVSGKTLESGRLQTVQVQIEQDDKASQGSTRALAGSLLNYEAADK